MQGNVVCDLDGVVYVAGDTVPGAGEALGRLTGAGLRVVFATNNSSRTPTTVESRIAAITGFTPRPGSVVTSGMAAATMLEPADEPVFVVGETGLADVLAAAGLALTTDPDQAASVVAGLHRSYTYDVVADAARAVRRGARFIASNDDATFPTSAGPTPGAGSMVAAIATAAGRDPEVAGKPHPPMQRLVASRLGPGPTWVVGDRADTDLALGAAMGATRVLVLTGIVRDAAAADSDHVLDSIAGLPGLLGVG